MERPAPSAGVDDRAAEWSWVLLVQIQRVRQGHMVAYIHPRLCRSHKIHHII